MEITKSAARDLIEGTLMFLAIPAVPIACYYLFLAIYAPFANASYAGRYFDEKVEIVDVLASRKMHPLIGRRWRDCTYAIVRFSEATAARLKDRGLASIEAPRDWPHRSEWQQTPVPPRSLNDAFLDCEDNFDDALNDEIKTILSEPGAWAKRRWSEVFVISPDHRLAAYVRYGD